MKILWLKRTDQDIEQAFDFMVEKNPRAAWDMLQRVQTRGDEHLRDNPELGPVGRVHGTRELVVSGTKMVLVYRLKTKNLVQIMRVLHSSQDWPPGGKKSQWSI